jgi:N5-(cytidine 5'-diphosphoramidyl)-L-glutamine hydrolase
MKTVAITTRINLEENYGEVRQSLDIKWIELLNYNGFNPVILPTGVDYPDYIKLLNIDGIIFTGGNDLFSVSKNDLSKLRDEKEKTILAFAIQESIPVYGVCRGMQIIAEYFGSTLSKIPNHVAVSHKIRPTHFFWGSEYLNESIMVNSYHNYGINLLSNELLCVAVTEDYYVEALIHKKLKIFGQMWHPEREKPFKVIDLNLMQKFFND